MRTLPSRTALTSGEYQWGPIGNVEIELEGFEQRSSAIRREIGVAQRYIKGSPILYRSTLCLGATFGYTVAGCDRGNVIVLRAHHVNGLHGVKTSIVAQARNQSEFLRRADSVFQRREHDRRELSFTTRFQKQTLRGIICMTSQ